MVDGAERPPPLSPAQPPQPSSPPPHPHSAMEGSALGKPPGVHGGSSSIASAAKSRQRNSFGGDKTGGIEPEAVAQWRDHCMRLIDLNGLTSFCGT